MKLRSETPKKTGRNSAKETRKSSAKSQNVFPQDFSTFYYPNHETIIPTDSSINYYGSSRCHQQSSMNDQALIQTLQYENAQLRVMLDKKDLKTNDFVNLNQENTKLKEENSRLLNEIDILTKENQKIKEKLGKDLIIINQLEKSREKNKKLKDTIISLNSFNEEVGLENQILKKQKEKLYNKVKKIKKFKIQIEEQNRIISQKDLEVQELNNEISQYRSKNKGAKNSDLNKKLQDIFEDFDETNGLANTFHDKANESYQLIESRAKIHELEKKITSYSNENDILQKENQSIKSKTLPELQILSDHCMQLENQISQYTELELEAQRLKIENSNLKQKNDELNHQIIEKNSVIDSLNNRIIKIQEQIEKKNHSLNKNNKASKSLEVFKAKNVELENQLISIQQERDVLKNKVIQLEKETIKVPQLQAKVDLLEKNNKSNIDDIQRFKQLQQKLNASEEERKQLQRTLDSRRNDLEVSIEYLNVLKENSQLKRKIAEIEYNL